MPQPHLGAFFRRQPCGLHRLDHQRRRGHGSWDEFRGLLDDGGGGFSQAATDRGDEHGAEHGVMDPPNSSS